MKLIEGGGKTISNPTHQDIDNSFFKLKIDEIEFLILESSKKEFIQIIKKGPKFRIELAINDGFIYSIQSGIRDSKSLLKEYLISGRLIFKKYTWKKENFKPKQNNYSLLQIVGILGMIISIVSLSNKHFLNIDESYSILVMLNSALLIWIHSTNNSQKWLYKRTEEKVKSLLILIIPYLIISLLIILKILGKN